MDRMVETYDIDDESYNSLRNVFMNMDLNTETVGEVNFPADISIEQLDNISGKTKHISYGGNHIRLGIVKHNNIQMNHQAELRVINLVKIARKIKNQILVS